METVAASLSLTKELDTIRVQLLITTNFGVHWILPTKATGEIVVSSCNETQ